MKFICCGIFIYIYYITLPKEQLVTKFDFCASLKSFFFSFSKIEFYNGLPMHVGNNIFTITFKCTSLQLIRDLQLKAVVEMGG